MSERLTETDLVSIDSLARLDYEVTKREGRVGHSASFVVDLVAEVRRLRKVILTECVLVEASRVAPISAAFLGEARAIHAEAGPPAHVFDEQIAILKKMGASEETIRLVEQAKLSVHPRGVE